MKQMKLLMICGVTLVAMGGCIFTPPAQERALWKRYEKTYFDESNPLMRYAKAQLGTPYRYGGTTPSGFDCSGFVSYVYAKGVGKNIPRTARAQSNYVQKIDKKDLRAGDLLFFDTSGNGVINHCAIYVSHGDFIHASSGRVYAVTISSLNSRFYKDAFRMAGRVPYR